MFCTCPPRRERAQNLLKCFGIRMVENKFEASEIEMVQYKMWSLAVSRSTAPLKNSVC